jgi:hypothetical protein
MVVLASDTFGYKRLFEHDQRGGTPPGFAAKSSVDGLAAPFAMMGAQHRLEKWRAVI